MHTVLFVDAQTLGAPPPKPLRGHRHQAGNFKNEAQVIEAINQTQAYIIVTNKLPISKGIIENCPSLKLICIFATGFNHVDIQAASAHGVMVTNLRDYGNRQIAEHTISLMLALRRNLAQCMQIVTDGTWANSGIFCVHNENIKDLSQSTVGIIGKGSIGTQTGKYAKMLGAKVLYGSLRPKQPLTALAKPYTELDDLLGKSDIVSLHCPLTEQTNKIVNKEFLAKMKRGGYLINTARGGLIDNSALINSLQSQHLAGAALDVLDQEPPDANHPLIKYQHPRLIITPHIAWASQLSISNAKKQLMKIINAYLRNQPINNLN